MTKFLTGVLLLSMVFLTSCSGGNSSNSNSSSYDSSTESTISDSDAKSDASNALNDLGVN